MCGSERAEASAGTYFNVSEATSNGGGAESGSTVIVPVACQSLPVRSLWSTVACRWIPSSPFKTSMLWTGAPRCSRQEPCIDGVLETEESGEPQYDKAAAGLGNTFRP
eukprot:symbB.v1.2.025896.t1/scaffold2544.1/size76561/1